MTLKLVYPACFYPCEEGGYTVILKKFGTKAVKKNLTIPAWLNTLAEKKNVNFSQVLQDALTEYLGLDQS